MPYCRAYYHLISGTQDRQPVITNDIEILLNRSFQLTANDLGLIVHATGFMADHMHMTLTIPPKLSMSETVRRLKGASAHRVNEQLAGIGFGWQRSYGFVTFGERDLPKVNNYVTSQKVRHLTGRLVDALERTDEEAIS